MATNSTTLAPNMTLTIEDINHRKFLDNLPILVFYVIIMVVGIVGNVLVLIIYKLQFKRSSARVYILTLAMTDLSVCVIGIPYHVLDIAMVVTYTNSGVCKVLSFLIGSCTLSSIFVLLVVGLDRYLKVCRPLKKQIIDFGDKRACLIAIAMAVFINIPNGIIYGNNTVTIDAIGINGTECFVSDNFQGSLFSIGYLGLMLLIFICSVTYLSIIYGFIVRKIYKTDPNQGEISIGNKNKWCSCVAPDTDSDNSDKEDENNGTPAETSILMKRQGATNKPSNGIYIETRHDVSAESINTETGSLDVSDSETNKTMSEGGDSGEEQTLNKNEQDRRDNLDLKETLVTASESHDNRRRSQPHKQKKRDKSKVKHVPSASMIRHTKKNDSKESHTRKITLIMFTITIVFIASYLPFIIISILDQVIEDYWERMTNSETILHNFLLRFYLINNMADPIIYGLWDKRFRSECVYFLKRICCCGKEDFRNRNRKKFSLATSTSKGYPSSAKSSRRQTAKL